ncbi:MAG: DUF4153 domain-containing protein [Sphingomicrobium sp.]
MNDRLDGRAQPWPARPWVMAGIGAAAGFLFYLLARHMFLERLPIWRQAAATFVVIASLSFLLTVERSRWLWTVGFAAAWGAVIALVGWFTARYNVQPTIFEWPYLSGLFAVMIAAPLFQTVRDEGGWSLPYERLHGHAWADAVIGAASLVFAGIVFLLAWMIAGLFGLIGIDEVRRLLMKDWFSWSLFGFAFGASVGLLRERDRLLPMLQRLLRIVLAVLAPPLAVALVLFLASIPFTGLEKFWSSGVPATPLLLVAGAGAILLSNTVFAEDRQSRSTNPVLRWSSLALIAVVLPLAAIAAMSIGARINQYGWTPERIWGVIAVAVAIVYGLTGWYAIWRGRLDFDEPLRPLQTKLAVGLCGLALFLALPIVDFGAISARSQLARLDSGQVAPSQFDWRAMAFDFGPSGRIRLRQIAKSGSPDLRPLAETALKATDRWGATQEKIVAGPPPVELTVYPKGAIVPPGLRDVLLHGKNAFCSEGGACRVYPQPGGLFVVFMDGCANLPPGQRDDPKIRCSRNPAVYQLKDGSWTDIYGSFAGIPRGPLIGEPDADDAAKLKSESEALDRGDVRIVPVEKHQLQVGGKPAGDVF